MTRRPVLVMVEQPDAQELAPKLNMAEDIYRHGRERAMDREHWAKVMVAADLREPIELSDRPRRWWRL